MNGLRIHVCYKNPKTVFAGRQLFPFKYRKRLSLGPRLNKARGTSPYAGMISDSSLSHRELCAAKTAKEGLPNPVARGCM